jgi:hypothetical protein
MERSNKLEDAVEKAGARQLAALLAVGMGGGGGTGRMRHVRKPDGDALPGVRGLVS